LEHSTATGAVPLPDNTHSCTGTDPARQPGWRQQLPLLKMAVGRVCPWSPTFHPSLPRASPPKKHLKPLPAEPTPHLLLVSGRLL